MRFSVTRNGRELRFSETLPPDLLPYKVFPITYCASGEWGAIIFQIMIAPEFCIWYSNYLIKASSSFLILSDIETTELHIATKNKLCFDTRGLGLNQLNEGQFNLSYLSEVATTGYFDPGEYESFDISYHPGYLQRFVPHFYELHYFLEQVQQKVSCHLYHTHPYATAAMMQAIRGLLQYNYNKGLSTIYLECKALELLTLAIGKMEQDKAKQQLVNPEEISLFETIKKWLCENVDYSDSLASLASMFYINEYKLKKGFKQHFDTTVFDYLLQLRMERAKKMLEETNLSITEIGYRAGYSQGPHFSDAFRKYFGFSPNFLRKK